MVYLTVISASVFVSIALERQAGKITYMWEYYNFAVCICVHIKIKSLNNSSSVVRSFCIHNFYFTAFCHTIAIIAFRMLLYVYKIRCTCTLVRCQYFAIVGLYAIATDIFIISRGHNTVQTVRSRCTCCVLDYGYMTINTYVHTYVHYIHCNLLMHLHRISTRHTAHSFHVSAMAMHKLIELLSAQCNLSGFCLLQIDEFHFLSW